MPYRFRHSLLNLRHSSGRSQDRPLGVASPIVQAANLDKEGLGRLCCGKVWNWSTGNSGCVPCSWEAFEIKLHRPYPQDSQVNLGVGVVSRPVG